MCVSVQQCPHNRLLIASQRMETSGSDNSTTSKPGKGLTTLQGRAGREYRNIPSGTGA